MAAHVDTIMKNFAPAAFGESSIPWGHMKGTRNFELFVIWARAIDAGFSDAVDPGPEGVEWDVDTAFGQIDTYYNS